MPEEREENPQGLTREEELEELKTGELIIAKTEERNAAIRKKHGLDNGGGGGTTGAITFEQFQKLSAVERTQFYRDHPTEYLAFMDRVRTANERALFEKGLPAL